MDSRQQQRQLRQVLAAVVVLLALVAPSESRPRADSAGIVPMPDGLAYGGIPYGSVTGKVAEYFRARGNPDGLGNLVFDEIPSLKPTGGAIFLQRL